MRAFFIVLAGVLRTVLLPAQSAPPALTPQQIHAIIQQVAGYQFHQLENRGQYCRYRLHRVDRKENTVRDVIESPDGNVGRLLLHNDQPLTEAENSGEIHRLRALLSDGSLGADQRSDKRSREYGAEMIRAMPNAMLFTWTPGQPQLPGLDRPQYVFDYAPDPAFHPHSLPESVLGSVDGRLWVDAQDNHLVRIEVNVRKNVDVAAGILVRVRPGGTVEYDQRRIAEGTYAYTHIRMHLMLREFMVKNAPYESDMTTSDIRLLQPAPGGMEAIRALLEDPVTTR